MSRDDLLEWKATGVTTTIARRSWTVIPRLNWAKCGTGADWLVE